MKTIEEQIGGKCIHFTGTISNVCKLGIEYKSFRTEEPLLKTIPCIRGGTGKCDKCQFPTPEDVAKQLKEISQESVKALKLLLAVKTFIKKNNKFSGQLPCPTCGHPAAFVIALSNGHIWAQCITCNIRFNE